MKVRSSFIVLAFLVIAVAGCSRHSGTTTASQKTPDLGYIKVSDGVQSQYDIGGGRVCIITPTILKSGSIQLDLQIEESNKVVASSSAQALPERHVAIFAGNIMVTLTPEIKQ